MSTLSNQTFEESLEQLEQLVTSLESGRTKLQDLVAKFETGSKLVQVCAHYLQEAELKIEKLRDDPGGPSMEPFEAARES